MPAVVVIVMAVCKCPSIPTLMVSTLVAVVLAKHGVERLLLVLPAGHEVAEACQDDPSKHVGVTAHWQDEVEEVFHLQCLPVCSLAWVAGE